MPSRRRADAVPGRSALRFSSALVAFCAPRSRPPARSRLHLPLPRMRVLPTVKTNVANDLINIVHDTLNNDRGLWIPSFLE